MTSTTSPRTESTNHDRAALRPSPVTQVFTLGDDFVVYAGGDEFLTLELGEAAAAELVAVLHGDLALRACTALETATAADITDELIAEGLIIEPPGAACPVPYAAVVGDGPIAEAVRGLLPRTQATVPGPDSPAVDLVIVCAGWLPDRDWQQLDRELAGRSIPWHRCWGDGTALYLGPLTLPGTGPGYGDVRQRQLAATDSPDLLQALWQHWDGTPPTTYPAPDPASTAMAAGLLAGDAFDLVAGRRPVGQSVQRELDLVTRQVIEHPVLPVPGSPWLPGHGSHHA